MPEKLCLQWNDIKENVNSVFGKLRGVWGWSSDGGSQSYLGFFKSLLWENTPKKQTLSPSDLPEGVSVKRFCFNSRLPLFWWGKRLPRWFGFFPCYRWRDQAEGSDWANLQWPGGGARKTQTTWTVPTSKKLVTTSPNYKSDGTHDSNTLIKTSKELAIPINSVADLQALDEQVKSMMEKGQKMVPAGKQRNETPSTCKMCGKEGHPSHIKDHIESNHLEGISIPCDYCDKNFSTRNSLRQHKNKFHK